MDRNEGTNHFYPHVLSLQTLGLATVEGGDIRRARLTRRGDLIFDHLQDSQRAIEVGSSILRKIETRPDRDLTSISADGRPVEDVFANSADHWYSLTIAKRGLYDIQTSLPSSPVWRNVDTVLYLFDSGDRRIGFDDDGGRGTYSMLRKDLNPGSYYLRVSSYEGLRGSYKLIVREHANRVLGVDACETASLPLAGEARVLPTSGELVSGQLDLTTTELWYRLNIQDNNRYVIETSPPEGMRRDVDTIIQLYDRARQTLLAEDDDGNMESIGFSSLVVNLSADTYYVRVRSYWGDTGYFQIAARKICP